MAGNLNSTKGIVIMEAFYAAYELGRLSGKYDGDIDEEIITGALFTVLDVDEDTSDSREQYKLLMGAYYTLRGIKDNLMTMDQVTGDEDNAAKTSE